MDDHPIYFIVAIIVGLLTFIGVWIYALFSWGFLIGLAIGWLPALIAAWVAGLLWPLVVAAAVIIIGLMIFSS
ncbi:MAG: hypothetical protein Q7S29_00505 [Candidatus Peribacter sp.]|nr:hypothetical protein [Candidatus Peribacter sp.]